jgi:membrane protein implicated in regulation of membrane protease activity
MGILALFGKKNIQEDDRGLDSIIGKRCVVTERIDNYAGCGQVKVNGQGWSARSAYDDECFEIGETLNIVAIEGVRLICVKN